MSDSNSWSDFANGKSGKSAQGSPTLNLLSISLNKPTNKIGAVSGNLYVPRTEPYENCNGYWMNHSYDSSSSSYCEMIIYTGSYSSNEEGNSSLYSVRPVVCLDGEAKGNIVNNIIHISE